MEKGPGGPAPTRAHGALSELSAEALALEVAEAEAEAEAAEARTAAAQARARAARLRRQAWASENGGDSDQVDTDAAPGDDASAERGEELEVDPPARAPRTRRVGLRPPRRGAVPVVLAALVSGAALAVSGYLLWHHHDVIDQEQRAAEFAAAARQGVVTLTTLDSGNAEEDVQRVLDNSTGAFRDDFQNRAGDFTDVIQKSNVATEGQVNAAAVESMTEDSAVVLVAATSKVTNSAGADQEPRAWRLSVTVTRDDGQLKMSKVEFVP